MAQYKLIEVLKTSEKETQSIYDKEDLDNALIEMHDDFGKNVKLNTTVGTCAVLINNTTGERVDGLSWGEPIRDRVYTHNNYAEDNIAAYESEQLAVGNYHTKYAAQRNNKECTHAVTIRLDGKGMYKDFDCYDKAQPTEQTGE